MIIRLATLEDIPEIMQLTKKVVPLMRASGNFQWGDDYPNPEVFTKDLSTAVEKSLELYLVQRFLPAFRRQALRCASSDSYQIEMTTPLN